MRDSLQFHFLLILRLCWLLFPTKTRGRHLTWLQTHYILVHTMATYFNRWCGAETQYSDHYFTQLIINSLSPGRCDCDFKRVNFKQNMGLISCAFGKILTLQWKEGIPEHLVDENSAWTNVDQDLRRYLSPSPNRPISQIPQCTAPYPKMHNFVTEMCTWVHISVTKWCIVGYLMYCAICEMALLVNSRDFCRHFNDFNIANKTLLNI